MTSRDKIAKPVVAGDRSHSDLLCWCARCIGQLEQVALENVFVWPALLGQLQPVRPAPVYARTGRRAG